MICVLFSVMCGDCVWFNTLVHWIEAKFTRNEKITYLFVMVMVVDLKLLVAELL